MRTFDSSWIVFLLAVGGAVAQAQAVAAQAGVGQAPVHPRVIVFVHGLHGDRTSWRAANGAYWPDMVKSDPRFAYSDVVVAEYPSPASNGKN